MIPTNLFTFYHDITKMPKVMNQKYEKMVRENPEFNCKLYDVKSGREFISQNFGPYVLIAYDKLKPYAYKSDLFRYCYIYIKGGIYVDIKYISMNNFKFIDLLDKEYLVSEPIGVQNCLLVLNPKNKMIFRCIHNVKNLVLNNFYGNTPLFTGPSLLSEKYKKFYKDNRIETDLRWCIEDNLQCIYKNDCLILREYPLYRKNLFNASDQPHYTQMFWSKDIYN
jgi:mannosyltransferase OCH1-like enzyme